LMNTSVYLIYLVASIYELCIYDPMGGWVEMGVTAIFASVHFGIFILVNLFAWDYLKKTN
jgi:hypothetical protein